MEEVLKKKISRKNFIKACAMLAAAGLFSFSNLSLFKKKDKATNGYGSGPYGV